MAGYEFGEALIRPAMTAGADQDEQGANPCDAFDATMGDFRSAMPKVVSIVEEHSFLRDCIHMGLKAACDYDLFAYNNVEEFQKDDRRGNCEIIITTCFGVDNDVFGDTLGKLRACEPGIPVLVLGPPRSEPINVAIAQGAKGYIPFTTKFDVVVQVIRVILAGGTYAPLDCLFRIGANGPDAHPVAPNVQPYKTLTARELSVVRAIQQGKSNKVIAYSLNMTESTVKVHVRHIMAKLKARNRTEIAVMSDKIGLALLEDLALS